MSGNYYYEDDQKQVIREALLDQQAISQAKSFKERDDQSRPRRPALTQTQLRRFYNDVTQLQKKYETQWREAERSGLVEKEAKASAFPRVKPHVKMLKSKVAYAFEKVPPTFENFMNETIDHIQDDRDFEAFLAHFEAVVGFSKKELRPN
jgi:CRISPR-associated protein Csm2